MSRDLLRVQAKKRLKELKDKKVLHKNTPLAKFWPIFLAELEGEKKRKFLMDALAKREEGLAGADVSGSDSFILDQDTFFDE